MPVRTPRSPIATLLDRLDDLIQIQSTDGEWTVADQEHLRTLHRSCDWLMELRALEAGTAEPRRYWLH